MVTKPVPTLSTRLFLKGQQKKFPPQKYQEDVFTTQSTCQLYLGWSKRLMSETGRTSTPMCVSRWYFQVKVICATPVIWVCGRDGIQVTSFLCNLMNCTCHLCGTQALGERVNDFDVLERDSGWFGAVSFFCAFAASSLFLQRCRHSTLTSRWKRLNGFGVSERDLGWFKIWS